MLFPSLSSCLFCFRCSLDSQSFLFCFYTWVIQQRRWWSSTDFCVWMMVENATKPQWVHWNFILNFSCLFSCSNTPATSSIIAQHNSLDRDQRPDETNKFNLHNFFFFFLLHVLPSQDCGFLVYISWNSKFTANLSFLLSNSLHNSITPHQFEWHFQTITEVDWIIFFTKQRSVICMRSRWMNSRD